MTPMIFGYLVIWPPTADRIRDVAFRIVLAVVGIVIGILILPWLR